MRTCNECAWYCHTDGRCYGNGAALAVGHPFAVAMDQNSRACGKWEFDGLEDWERDESCDLIVTEVRL